MPAIRDVSALILAGGKATRLGGIAKHELVIDPTDGRTIFERQVAVLAPRVSEIIVSSAKPASTGFAGARSEANAERRSITGYRCVIDTVEGAGPLAGIAAGLSASRTTWLLVVAGDMPHLTPALIDRMILALPPGGTSSIDAVGIRAGGPAGLPEPLLSILHRSVLAAVERRLAAQRYKASGLLTHEGLRVTWIDDADPAALRNVNSPGDL